MDENEKDYYEGISKAEDFINQRLHDSIESQGLNNTDVEDEVEESTSITQRVIEGQESNYFPL